MKEWKFEIFRVKSCEKKVMKVVERRKLVVTNEK
jgi:hypothetical protein